MKHEKPAVISIAGVDPSGGAGIFADFRAIEACGAKALGAVTALTVQGERFFQSHQPVDIEILISTLEYLASDFPKAVVKTGMLPTADTVSAVVNIIKKNNFKYLVVDPVFTASAGKRLVTVEAERAIISELIPLADLVTPNLAEATRITGIEVSNEAEMIKAGNIIRDLGVKAAAITGGHLEGDALDILVSGQEVQQFSSPRFEGTIHGTGCSFSSYLAASLAKGVSPVQAVASAKKYVSGLFRSQASPRS